jgi:Iap family predicted aminopeptidase
MSPRSTQRACQAPHPGELRSSPSLEGAVDRLVADGYPRSVVERLTAIGGRPGHRLAGSPADMESAKFIAGEMQAIGLVRVRRERVDVDVWDTRGAEVVVDGTVLRASQWAGVPGTPPGGLSAPLVYVRGGESDDYRAAGDVTGRIVLVDLQPSSYWVAIVGMEAFARGAVGMIVTSTRTDTAMFSGRDLLAASNATYATSGAPPFVYVSRRDGDWLKRRLARGSSRATVRSEVVVTPLDEGGHAHNVLGELPGSAGDDDLLVLGAHHDAYFAGALDNASGVAGLLTLARAMVLSGHHPERTIVFVSHAAEEFGLADSPYDWCIGSWRLLGAHPHWPGKVSAELELDEIGYYTQPLWALNVPEFGPWLKGTIDRPRARLWPQDSVTSFSDQWAYSAQGIPSIHFGNVSAAYERTLNHTDGDTPALLDYATLAKNIRTVARVTAGLDMVGGRLLPLALEERARDVAAAVRAKELTAAGCDAEGVRDYGHSLAAFTRAARRFAARRQAISPPRYADVNRGLLGVVARLNRALAALDRRDGDSYPHRTQLSELQRLAAAIDCCRSGATAAALESLTAVSFTATGCRFSHATYRRFLARLSPSYDRLGPGAWGRLPSYVDVVPEYRAIEAGRCKEALAGLESKRAAALADLDERLGAVAAALLRAAGDLDVLV